MEPLLRREHARAACRAPAELERGLDGLGARIREENVRESRRRAPAGRNEKEPRCWGARSRGGTGDYWRGPPCPPPPPPWPEWPWLELPWLPPLWLEWLLWLEWSVWLDV